MLLSLRRLQPAIRSASSKLSRAEFAEPFNLLPAVVHRQAFSGVVPRDRPSIAPFRVIIRAIIRAIVRAIVRAIIGAVIRTGTSLPHPRHDAERSGAEAEKFYAN